MAALAPTSSGALGGAAALGGSGLSPRLPVSTASASDARLVLVEQQLLAAEQQRDAANQQLVEALQRSDAAAADAARCAALQQRLQEQEVRLLVRWLSAPVESSASSHRHQVAGG